MARLIAAGLWLSFTMAATGLVWTATSMVAADMTDRPAPVLAHREVVSALDSGSSDPSRQSTPSVPTTVRRAPTTSRPTAPVSDAGDAPSSPPTTSPPPPAAPPPTTPQVLPPPTTVPVAPPTTQAPSRPTASYSTAGGVVSVACDGFFIHLLSATPKDGYAVWVVAGGPGNVDVRFLRPGQDTSVKAVCFGQPIQYSDSPPDWWSPPS